MEFAGIDYSMTCPAITIGSHKEYEKCKTFFYCKDKKLEGKHENIYGMLISPYETEMERFENISEWAMAILHRFSVTHVCLEGYSMGSKGRVFGIAENTGLLKYKMWKAGINFETPAPTTVKKYFTGKGNSDKIAMYESFVDKTGVDPCIILNKKAKDNPVSDIVDSYAMLRYGIDEIF